MESNNITGIYQHYKGNQYRVIGVGTHTETKEQLIVYESLNKPFTIWVRPYAMFFETVAVGGRQTPRFLRLGE